MAEPAWMSEAPAPEAAAAPGGGDPWASQSQQPPGFFPPPGAYLEKAKGDRSFAIKLAIKIMVIGMSFMMASNGGYQAKLSTLFTGRGGY